MRFAIPVSAGVLAIIALTAVDTLTAGEGGESAKCHTMIYAVADLPVWSGDPAVPPTFDPAILMALIQAKAGDDAWGEGTQLLALASKASLVISQTSERHEQIVQLLDSLRPRDQREQSERLSR